MTINDSNEKYQNKKSEKTFFIISFYRVFSVCSFFLFRGGKKYFKILVFKMIIQRKRSIASMHTFTITPIKQLVHKYCNDGKGWIDPFAGENSPAEFTNDLNPVKPTKYHLEAKDFITEMKGKTIKGILFDPPYSYRQISECYEGVGLKAKGTDTCANFYSRVKEPAARLLTVGGIVICCGWNSNGFGKQRGFEIIEMLCVAHGSHHNDTIVTVERKFKDELF